MKLRERLYSLLIAFPTALLTSIQILLLLRFISKLIELDPQLKAIDLLYTITTTLVFPFILILEFFSLSDGILFEALLLPSIVIYALLYEIIRLILVKIFSLENE